MKRFVVKILSIMLTVTIAACSAITPELVGTGNPFKKSNPLSVNRFFTDSTEEIIKSYTDLNNVANPTDNDPDRTYRAVTLNVSEIPVIYNATLNDLDKIIASVNKGKHYIFFGFPECPWCRIMVERLLPLMKEKNVEEIIYVNALEDRKAHDKAACEEEENGCSVLELQKADNYTKLLAWLGNNVSKDDKGNKRLYFPTIYLIEDGEIIDHIVSFETNGEDIVPEPYKELSEKQEQQINEFLEAFITQSNK